MLEFSINVLSFVTFSSLDRDAIGGLNLDSFVNRQSYFDFNGDRRLIKGVRNYLKWQPVNMIDFVYVVVIRFSNWVILQENDIRRLNISNRVNARELMFSPRHDVDN